MADAGSMQLAVACCCAVSVFIVASLRTATRAGDESLVTPSTADPQTPMLCQARPVEETTVSLALRSMVRYWYHSGEAHAVRQMLGHSGLPQFVGDIRTPG